MTRSYLHRGTGYSVKYAALITVTLASTLLMACGGGAAPSAPTAAPTTAAAAPVTTTAPTEAPASPTTAPATATTAPAPTATSPAATATTAPAPTDTAAPAATATTAAAPTAASGPTKLTGAPVPLVVYSAQGYDSDVVKAFQAKTGIPTQLVDDSTGPLLAKIQAEKNNPQWGLLWVDGDEAFASMDQQGMLLQGYLPDVAWTEQAKSVLPKNQSYVPTGLTAAGTLVYDTRFVKNPPKTWQDLLKPEWKGLVGMNNPAVSGPTFPFVAGMMQNLGGEDQGKAFYTQLKANGLHIYDTNGVTLKALDSGEIKIALIQSSAGVGAGVKTKTLKTEFLPKVSLLPGVIGIDAKVSPQEQTEAKMFVEFVLSPAGQDLMLKGDPEGDSVYWPVMTGTAPLSILPPITSIPAQVLDPYVWGAKEAEINQWFSENIAQ